MKPSTAHEKGPPELCATSKPPMHCDALQRQGAQYIHSICCKPPPISAFLVSSRKSVASPLSRQGGCCPASMSLFRSCPHESPARWRAYEARAAQGGGGSARGGSRTAAGAHGRGLPQPLPCHTRFVKLRAAHEGAALWLKPEQNAALKPTLDISPKDAVPSPHTRSGIDMMTIQIIPEF